MGGCGSGVPSTSYQRPVVEESRTLDLEKLVRTNNSKDWGGGGGAWCWTDARTGEKKASIKYHLKRDNDDQNSATLTLEYTNTSNAGVKTDVKIPLRMECTFPLYGGRRWWVTCPLVINNICCARRVSRLYAVVGTPYFGCRRCFKLTYQSSNDSHKYDGMYAMLAMDSGMSPEIVKRMMAKDGFW